MSSIFYLWGFCYRWIWKKGVSFITWTISAAPNRGDLPQPIYHSQDVSDGKLHVFEEREAAAEDVLKGCQLQGTAI